MAKRAYSDFGKQIAKGLIDAEMSAQELANTIGTTPQYLNKILHGERSGKTYRNKIKKILNIA